MQSNSIMELMVIQFKKLDSIANSYGYRTAKKMCKERWYRCNWG